MAQSSRPYTGIFPVAPTPFTATGDLDLEGQRRVLDCMLDQGVDGICVLANYSEQFLLSDQEGQALRLRFNSRVSHFNDINIIEQTEDALRVGNNVGYVCEIQKGRSGYRTCAAWLFARFEQCFDFGRDTP